ncbi:MAG: F0F1 ATP synthase subunit B [Micrococcales bacterium]
MISRILANAAEGSAQPNPLLPASYDLLWSSVVFVILLAFFWFKVLPNFKKTLEARTEAIEGRLEAAEKAQAEAAAKTANIEAEQAAARAEAAQIREAARTEGAAILAELKEQAASEAARITATAKAQIEAERQAALISLRAEVGAIAIDLASSVVGASLQNDKIAAGVVDQFLGELEAGDKAGKK